MVTPTSPDDARVVDVWHATIDDLRTRDAAAVDRARHLLRTAERARYDRFRHDDDREMFLLGRVVARSVVARALGVTAAEWAWREGPRGRPEIDSRDCAISFNLAHSGGLVVCAISRVGAVGVDVEHRHRAPVDRALVTRCCAAEESADVDAHGADWRDRFLQYWTLKESYLKAVGLGISVHLPDVRFRLGAVPTAAFTGTFTGADAGWTFELQQIAPAHYVAVAASTPDGTPPVIRHAPFPAAWWP